MPRWSYVVLIVAAWLTVAQLEPQQDADKFLALTWQGWITAIAVTVISGATLALLGLLARRLWKFRQARRAAPFRLDFKPVVKTSETTLLMTVTPKRDVFVTQIQITLPIIPHEPEPVHMYWLRVDQIDALSSEFNSISLGMCTTMLGLFVGFIVAITTTAMSDRAIGIYVGLSFGSGGLALGFGVHAIYGLVQRYNLCGKIKRTQAITLPGQAPDTATPPPTAGP